MMAGFLHFVLAVACRGCRFGGSAATSLLAGVSIFNFFDCPPQGMMLRALQLEFDNPRPLGCRKFRERPRQSGERASSRAARTIPLGYVSAGRKALWMVVLDAVRCNPWLSIANVFEPRANLARSRHRGDAKVAAATWSVATHRRPFVPQLPAMGFATGREFNA
jgi:hypothetical protein